MAAIQRFIKRRPLLKRGWYTLWGLFSVWLVSFAVFIISLQQQIELSRQPLPDLAAIIVLGSGTVDGKPTPTLASRLDSVSRRLLLLSQQPSLSLVAALVFGRDRSEADIMASYLNEAHQIALDSVWQEDKSTSTEENLVNSKALLAAQGISISNLLLSLLAIFILYAQPLLRAIKAIPSPLPSPAPHLYLSAITLGFVSILLLLAVGYWASIRI